MGQHMQVNKYNATLKQNQEQKPNHLHATLKQNQEQKPNHLQQTPTSFHYKSTEATRNRRNIPQHNKGHV
jgi:hypothetical protein